MPRPLLPLLLLLSCSSTLLLSAPPTLAQSTSFPKVPCNSTVPNVPHPLTQEFHPLRPYPGSPCDPLIPINREPELSFACGKSLNTEGDVIVSPGDPRCKDDPSKVCKTLDFDIKIDLSPTKIPILGNTEDPSLDDATKINNYLSYYLNGTLHQTDQLPLDSTKPEDIDRLVNYSGPINKLLPQDTQEAIRSTAVLGPINSQYHNYRVGCKKNFDLDYVIKLITGTLKNNFATAANFLDLIDKMGGLNPQDFITLASALTQISSNHNDFGALSEAVRILSTESTRVISFADNFSTQWQIISSQISLISLDAVEACSTSTDLKRLNDFKGHLPPDPTKYDNFDNYWKDYTTWRGNIYLPLFGNTGIGNPFISGFWSQLFQNINFATLEDTTGEIIISALPGNHQEPNVSNLKLTILPTTDARVYTPHVKNLKALSQIITGLIRPLPQSQDGKNLSGLKPNDPLLVSQQLAQSQGYSDKTPIVANYNLFQPDNNSSVIPGRPAPAFPVYSNTFHPTEYDQTCDLKDFRVNSGDSLHGQSISAHLTYTQKFTPPKSGGGRIPAGGICVADGDCQTGVCQLDSATNQKTCIARTQPTKAKVAVFTKLPGVDELYINLVTKSDSLLRRFLPGRDDKPDPNLPCSSEYLAGDGGDDTICLGNTTPAAGDAAYSITDSKGVSNAHATAGDGDETQVGQVFFGRLGSLSDYLLGASDKNQNLQHLLRPQGFQGTPPSGSTTTSSQLTCTLPISPNHPNCTVNWDSAVFDAYAKAYNSDDDKSWTLVKEPWAQAIIDTTSSWTCPKFITTLWLEESGGSALGKADLGCLVYLDGTPAKTSDHRGGPESFSNNQAFRNHYEPILRDQVACLHSYVTAIDDFRSFMCQYSGEEDTDPSQPYRQCQTFTHNPNFPNSICRIGLTEMQFGSPTPPQ